MKIKHICLLTLCCMAMASCARTPNNAKNRTAGFTWRDFVDEKDPYEPDYPGAYVPEKPLKKIDVHNLDPQLFEDTKRNPIPAKELRKLPAPVFEGPEEKKQEKSGYKEGQTGLAAVTVRLYRLKFKKPRPPVIREVPEPQQAMPAYPESSFEALRAGMYL